MNRVRVLSDQVANQIAAGEVVERPASVVKELVENAIDADARKITVEIQAGGRALIRVTDDGIGMSRDDALLALERHGTSKLRTAEDLSSIGTMGFRGEAVPSIASVSRFILTTRERGDASPDGAEIVVDGGKLKDVKSAGRAPGSTVEVRQLFFNLPARRKFLKSQETERAHIQQCLALAALAHPEIAFDFRQDNRWVWRLPAASKLDSDALRERLRALYGADLEMIPVELSREWGGDGETQRIWGFTGAPGVSRATRQDQRLFVNRRPIENRGLNQALLEGCQTTLPKGRYPICCLFLELPADSVDVNIHPAKREVKFHREGEVRRLVSDAVRDALLRFHRPEGAAAETGATDGPAGAESWDDAAPVAEPFPTQAVPVADDLDLPTTQAPPESQPGGNAPPPAPAPSGPREQGRGAARTPKRDSPVIDPRAAERLAALESEIQNAPAEPAPLLKVPLRMLGVIAGNYIAFETDRGLALMDQRAAHERVLYERMLEAAKNAAAPSQRLLLPETVELSARDAQFVREHLETLTRLGVGLSEFGEQTFLLDALPPFAAGVDARRFVLELIDDLKAAGAGQTAAAELNQRTIARSICHRAVRVGEALSGPELRNLVEDLRRCAMPYTCPAGRPTLVEISERELARKFGRVG